MKSWPKIFALTLVVASFMVFIGTKTFNDGVDDSKKNQDIEDIIYIAEQEFVKRYGNSVLEQRPWLINTQGEVIIVKGTQKKILGRKNFGGVAMIVINKTDRRVIHCTHGK